MTAPAVPLTESDAEAIRFAHALALALARIAAERAGHSSEVH